MSQAAEVESQVRLLEETLEGSGRRRSSSKSNPGLAHEVTGGQFARWNPFDGSPASQKNGARVLSSGQEEIGQGSSELSHSCSSQARLPKRSCSPGSEGLWREGGEEKSWEADHEKRNGWAPQFSSLPNGNHPSSDHRLTNGGNILMVRL